MPKLRGSGVSGSSLRTTGQIKKEKESKNSGNIAGVPKSNVYAIDGNKGSLSNYKLPAGIVAIDDIIPAPCRTILEAQFKSLGLPIDTSVLAVRAENRQQVLKQLEDFAEMLHRDSLLLPRMLSAIKKCLKAATKSAQAQASMIKASLKEQANIDEAQAEMIMALMGYGKKRNTLQLKLERKVKQQQAIKAAQAKYYDKSWGAAKERIDTTYEFLTDVALAKEETKKKTAENRKNKDIERENWIRETL